MIAFIDDHRGAHGVEPICKVLPIAPSTYQAHVAKRRDPARLSARARRDVALKVGVVRGKPVRTTIRDKAALCPLDHVNRQFKASRPNVLWLSDFTYVATWTGFIYVAFVIDA